MSDVLAVGWRRLATIKGTWLVLVFAYKTSALWPATVSDG